MKLNAFEPHQPVSTDPLGLGIPADLVFDDDPLGPLLGGLDPIAPTPANVLEIWRLGLDRSEACARALSAVLVQNPDSISAIGDLDGAEQCLRSALESNPPRKGASLAACLASLGRILELRKQTIEAESFYRQALELQEKFLGPDHKVTCATGLRLLHLLEQTDRKDETTRLRNQIKAQSLTRAEDEADLTNLRSVALDMFLAGQYAEAEAIYLRLVERRFEPGSTHCHLARVYLMTDREPEARREVDRASDVRHLSPAYVLTRIQFFKTLLPMLAGAEWKPCLVELKKSLAEPGACGDWTIQPVLDHLKGRLAQDNYDLLTAVAAAISQRSKLAELESNPLWRRICGSAGTSADTTRDRLASPETLPERPSSDAESETDSAGKFTFGTIVKVAGDCVTLREYNFASDSDVENDYRVTGETDYSNVAKANDLIPGDSVVLDYKESNGQRLALVLVKEERESSEEPD